MPADHRRSNGLGRHALTLDHQQVLSAFGRTLIVVGLLALSFAAFQLWGTGLVAAQAQDELAAQFRQRLSEPPLADPPAVERDPAAPAAASTGGLSLTARNGSASAAVLAVDKPSLDPSTPEGEPVASLVIPAIEVHHTVVQGTGRDALAAGPGHYRSTPMPGHQGNSGIAGHRTTHGAPFLDIDQLEPGDEILVETVEGSFTYVVEGQDDGAGGMIGHRIVEPSEVSVLADRGDTRLTLTACHPKYSARERIVVTATLVGQPITDSIPGDSVPGDSVPGDPVPGDSIPGDWAGRVTASQAETVTLAEPSLRARGVSPAMATLAQHPSSATVALPAATAAIPSGSSSIGVESADAAPAGPSLGWQRDHLVPTLRWVAAVAAMCAVAFVVGRLWRRVPAYAMAVPPVVLGLFNLFANLERFLPAL
jgi:sortase A